MEIKAVLAGLVAGRAMSAPEAGGVFEELLAGRMEESQIGAVLALVQARGATAEEIEGAARVMRRHVTPVAAGPGVVDTCGTGGARKTFNVSTLAALVAAAAGVPVAKHGNRGRSGRGSAEVLAALGVNVDATPGQQARCLREAGICFCFSVHHHPAMRHAAGARKALGFPTLFNVLGPLTNPAGARRQVMGVYEAGLVEKIGEVQRRLGAERAMVVHGRDGIDEISTAAATLIAHVDAAGVRVEEFDAAAYVPRAESRELDAVDLADAVRIARGVLAGEAGPARDIVAVNAAAALIVGGVAADWREGIERAGAAMASGAAARTLEMLVTLSGE